MTMKNNWGSYLVKTTMVPVFCYTRLYLHWGWEVPTSTWKLS